MKYIICGKSDSFYIYRKNNQSEASQICHAKTKQKFDEIKEEDTIVLLSGWWARTWAKEALRDIKKIYPSIKFEYMDGAFGENERKTLISESISNRFDILDL